MQQVKGRPGTMEPILAQKRRTTDAGTADVTVDSEVSSSSRGSLSDFQSITEPLDSVSVSLDDV